MAKAKVKITELTNENSTFHQWKRAVDIVFSREYIMTPEDALGDWLSRDSYDSGETVQEAVDELGEKVSEEYGSFLD